MQQVRVGVICGGPSRERGISLNSARSVMEHLLGIGVEVIPFYVDHHERWYQLSPAQLYSNTPSDFDFKLQTVATPLDEATVERALRALDAVFPLIHGHYGEDGTLPAKLAAWGIPFVGSTATTCATMYDKSVAQQQLQQAGFATLPRLVLDATSLNETVIAQFLSSQKLTRVVVKPARGGSSLGVSVATSAGEALAQAQQLLTQGYDNKVLIEAYASGREFTVIVLQTPADKALALVPLEIEMPQGSTDIFDFRRKYLATRAVTYHCPPRFDDATIAHIRTNAERVFTQFAMRDFARLDGWLLDNGTLYFSDLNPISGMEQNSFIFQQAARLGMTHGDVVNYLLNRALARAGKPAWRPLPMPANRRPVWVIFGGNTAERQVSLMSGTNVWFKLERSHSLASSGFLLAPDGQVWPLSRAFALAHSVEEIVTLCQNAPAALAKLAPYQTIVREALGSSMSFNASLDAPQPYSLEQFITKAQKAGAFVFIGLHGGLGEDGTIQAMLEKAGLSYNGSNAAASQLGMDKARTGEVVASLRDPAILTAPRVNLNVAASRTLNDQDYANLWQDLTARFGTSTLLIKPRADGCSAGVARLYSAADLSRFMACAQQGEARLAPQTLHNQTSIIEMPTDASDYLVEAFIETDRLRIDGARIAHERRSGWIEMTMGILEQHGQYHALNPSITVVEGQVLSLEEKFQGGTGVNLTPPPATIIAPAIVEKAKRSLEKVATAMGLGNYARCDLFVNIDDGRIIVIEANTLPGLTASTVIFHQALAENPPLYPLAFLERLITTASDDRTRTTHSDKIAKRANGL